MTSDPRCCRVSKAPGGSRDGYTVKMDLIEDIRGADDFASALARILEHFHCDGGTIHMLGSDGILHLEAASMGMPELVLATIRDIPRGKGMAGLALERNESVETCNLQEEVGDDVRPGAKATGFGGSIAVPVRNEDGEAVGALGVATVAERTFTSEEHANLIACGEALACFS